LLSDFLPRRGTNSNEVKNTLSWKKRLSLAKQKEHELERFCSRVAMKEVLLLRLHTFLAEVSLPPPHSYL
jgi:hypothetical protein